ncbi:MAG: GNAT family N-acetyltransferase [Balneolales bacterium]|nr:GNAT family N-acetyltransferase [Balneolales bacterium]
MQQEATFVKDNKPIATIHRFQSRTLSLEIHTDERVFSKLSSDWATLVRTSNQLVCMTPEWAYQWWKHLGRNKNRSLFIVTVYDRQNLVAIFPFYKGITQVGGIILQKRLQLIGSGGNPSETFGFSDDYGISDFLDIIVHPDYSKRIAEIFVNFLQSPELSDFQITFHQARDDSYIMQKIHPVLNSTPRKVTTQLSDECYYVDLDEHQHFEGFVQSAKANARRRFRQSLRACEPGNEYIIEEPTGPDDVERMINKLIQLHQHRWNKRGYPGAFQDERFVSFFKEICFSAYRNDRLWIKQAVDKDGVCAVRMALQFNGRFYDYMSGYDEDSPSVKFRPGIGLLLDLIKDAYKHSFKRLELLRGDEDYKHDFTCLTVSNWKITLSEVRHRIFWIPVALAQFCSLIHKYYHREKMIIRILYKNDGVMQMILNYFKFRTGTVVRKLRRKRISR